MINPFYHLFFDPMAPFFHIIWYEVLLKHASGQRIYIGNISYNDVLVHTDEVLINTVFLKFLLQQVTSMIMQVKIKNATEAHTERWVFFDIVSFFISFTSLTVFLMISFSSDWFAWNISNQ